MKKKPKHYHPVIGIVILLVIAAGVAWYVRRPEPVTPNENVVVDHSAALTTNENGEVVPKLKNALNVSDQAADTSIDIDYLSLQDPGYVVIRQEQNGQPGKILAKSNLLTAGAKQDLLIRYTTKSGEHYVAMLYSDDGDDIFNAATDKPIIGSDGGPIMAAFAIQ